MRKGLVMAKCHVRVSHTRTCMDTQFKGIVHMTYILRVFVMTTENKFGKSAPSLQAASRMGTFCVLCFCITCLPAPASGWRMAGPLLGRFGLLCMLLLEFESYPFFLPF